MTITSLWDGMSLGLAFAHVLPLDKLASEGKERARVVARGNRQYFFWINNAPAQAIDIVWDMLRDLRRCLLTFASVI